MSRALSTIIPLFMLVACGGSGPGDVTPSTGPDAVAAALNNPARPEADREKDARRKPGEVLTFFGIEPGMRVLDMFAGGGYYTELLAYIVGDDGVVYCQNNKSYRDYATDEIDQRFANNRLPHVVRLDVEIEDIDIPPGELDAVLLILSYHDIYYAPGDGSWPDIDGPEMLQTIYDALAPGGVLGVVDHSAVPGTPNDKAGNELHRIDEESAKAEILAAGFVLDGEHDALRNPDDDRSKPMFVEGIRGYTDRFILRFRKPEN